MFLSLSQLFPKQLTSVTLLTNYWKREMVRKFWESGLEDFVLSLRDVLLSQICILPIILQAPDVVFASQLCTVGDCGLGSAVTLLEDACSGAVFPSHRRWLWTLCWGSRDLRGQKVTGHMEGYVQCVRGRRCRMHPRPHTHTLPIDPRLSTHLQIVSYYCR